MAKQTDLPEPDRIAGAPHPRETPVLCGQRAAEAQFLEAYSSGRLHHAWLISGLRGVGKATLAWRIARFLLAAPDTGAPQSLDIDPGHPVARQLAAGAAPGLMVIRRGHDDKGRLKTVITVEEVRRLRGFFGLSASDGGRRVVIVDAADEMNTSASNAVLKLLEEPPPRATLLLVAHQPAALLPTIRSRCRSLRLAPLGAADMAQALAQTGADPGPDAAALAELSGGSVGAAFSLVQDEGLALYTELLGILGGLPRLDRMRVLKLAESVATRAAESRFRQLLALTELMMARLARHGALQRPAPVEAAEGEAALLARLASTPDAACIWADAAQTLLARARAGAAVNLDPAGLVLDMLLGIEARARGLEQEGTRTA